MKNKSTPVLLSLFFLVTTCSENTTSTDTNDKEVVLVGLDGREFSKPEMSETVKSKLDSNLSVARTNFDKEQSEENFIWLGRREAYLYNYAKAIDIFSEGLQKYPESYRLFRHRGHRYITMRQFDKAIEDLERAADLMPTDSLETEPDGQPNALNIPLSSTQFNVWYHLALARYLNGDFGGAVEDYERCMETSVNDDLLTATVDWLYMALRRSGQADAAKLALATTDKSMKIIENASYYKRLLMYKGQFPPDSVLKVSTNDEDQDLSLATQGYGVGNWYLYNGDTTRAVEIFRKVTAGKHFSAFGFIAAEADLVRLAER